MTNIQLLESAIESEKRFNEWLINQFNSIQTAISDLSIKVDIAISKTTTETEPDADGLLSLKESAAYLKVSVPTLRNYITKGLIATTQLSKGCNLKFKKSDLDNYLSATRKKSKAEIIEIANNLLGAN